MRTWKSLFAVSLLLGGAAACGDDEGGGDIDANVPDIDAEVPDSMPPGATRSMTIAVTDIELTSPQGGPSGAGIRGGVISAEFLDLTSGGGELVFGTSPVGGCVVQRFDVDGDPNGAHPPVGAGAITISGDGLLKTVGPCAYTQGVGYLCSSHGGSESIQAVANGSRAVTYVYSGTPFMDDDLVGSYLNINGFTGAAYNTGASAIPIIAQGNNTLTALAPADVAAGTETTAVAFAVFNGAGPVPTRGLGIPVDADFLGDETTSVQVQLAASAEWAAIDYTVYTRGEGFALSDESTQPHEFPTTAADATFTCEGTNGDCGADGDAPAGTVEAVIVSGRTTDGDVAGLPDFIMPPATTEYATFQCGFILAQGGTVPSGAVQAILDTNPTRIETRVLRIAGTQPMDGLNSGNLVVGHGLVGHTTVTPP